MVGSKETIAYSLKQTLKQLEDQIPATFLVRLHFKRSIDFLGLRIYNLCCNLAKQLGIFCEI